MAQRQAPLGRCDDWREDTFIEHDRLEVGPRQHERADGQGEIQRACHPQPAVRQAYVAAILGSCLDAAPLIPFRGAREGDVQENGLVRPPSPAANNRPQETPLHEELIPPWAKAASMTAATSLKAASSRVSVMKFSRLE